MGDLLSGGLDSSLVCAIDAIDLKYAKYLLCHALEGLDYLKDFAAKYCSDDIFKPVRTQYTHAQPFTGETLLLREIFEKYYPWQGEIIVDFRMSNKAWEGCSVSDLALEFRQATAAWQGNA